MNKDEIHTIMEITITKVKNMIEQKHFEVAPQISDETWAMHILLGIRSTVLNAVYAIINDQPFTDEDI